MSASATTLRQARPDDMLGCARVFLRSSSDLSRRMGGSIPKIRAQDSAFALAHLQRTDPRGFHVAVKGGRIVAFASTIRRGKTHFLSMFWTLPNLQSKGIGRRLLTRAFERPRPPASAVRCVFASLDTRAQTLYRNEEAAQQYEEACRIRPEDYQAPIFLAMAYQKLGRRAYASACIKRSVEAAKKHLAFNADDARALYLGAGGLVELGELDLAQEWVARALQIDSEDALVLYNVACVYAQLGEYEKSLDCIEKSFATSGGSTSLNWMKHDPYFDPVREHPRYKQLVARLSA